MTEESVLISEVSSFRRLLRVMYYLCVKVKEMVRVEKSELHTIGEQCLKDMRTIGEYNSLSVIALSLSTVVLSI